MNGLAFVYLWKEWRAQRALLIAYGLLMTACLCLGLAMAPTHYWHEEGFGVHALTWFVAAGVIGVVAFVAPALVRGEFTTKGDQFVRRLPGALGPAFVGKLLFLSLCTLFMPLAMLLVGELFVTWSGGSWDRLFRWDWFGNVYLEWPMLALASGAALLLAPWIWAIGAWLPGGRMALGGVMLFVLLLGLGVAAVLRQSPNLEQGISWHGWWWFVAPLGLGVAHASWAIGRRGGGALRSARFGLSAAAVGLVPPGAWFADQAWCYHHPDPQALVDLRVTGLSPDARYALVSGAGNENWVGLPFRIDLAEGSATQLGGVYTSISPGLVRPYTLAMTGRQRYWAFWNYGDDHRLLDLQTGDYAPLPFDQRTNTPVLDQKDAARIDAELREITPLRLPGNRPVWMRDGWLVTDTDGGGVRRIVEVPRPAAVMPAGHGVRHFASDAKRVIELESGGELPVKRVAAAYWVRDLPIFVAEGARRAAWQGLRDGNPAPVAALAGCDVLGLADDDRLLCAATDAPSGKYARRLFLFCPATEVVEEIPVPKDLPWRSVQAEPLLGPSALLPRDPSGNVWLRCSDGSRDVFVRLRLQDLRLQALPRETFADPGRWQQRVLAFVGENRVLVQDGDRIVALDPVTGGIEVLFPRPAQRASR